MTRFVRDALLFALLQAVVLTGFLWRYYDLEASFPMYSATRIKHDRLDAAADPRLILVGGSNLLYGIDSPRLEDRTGHHPVNMGLIGGLRLEYLLREVEATVRERDLVVLALEYPQLNTPAEAANPQVLMRVLWSRPANARHLSWAHWRLLADEGAVQQLGIAFRHACKYVRSGTPRRRPQEINEYGDLTTFHASDRTPPGRRQQTIPRQLRTETVERNIARLNELRRRCRAAGAEVVYTYPPVPAVQFERQQRTAEAFHAMLLARLEVPIITTQRGMLFQAREFINVSYHLFGPAVARRTDRLADAIEAYLATDRESWRQPAFDDVVPRSVEAPD